MVQVAALDPVVGLIYPDSETGSGMVSPAEDMEPGMEVQMEGTLEVV